MADSDRAPAMLLISLAFRSARRAMDEIVRRYIEEVGALQTRRAETLSAEDLADIAREVGLGESDLAAVDAEVEAHLVRARNFAANEMWDDALQQVDSVTGLAPHRADGVELRAQILAGRWKANGRDEDRVQALELSRLVVQRDPGQVESYRLIKELQKPRSRRNYVAGGVVGAAFAGVIAWAATASMLAVVPTVICVVVLAVLSSRVARPGAALGALPGGVSLAGLLPGPGGAPLSDHPQADHSKLEIPLVLDDPAAWEHVAIRVRQRDVDTYPDATFCRLVLEIRPTREEQIDGLKARIVVEADGEEIFGTYEELIGKAGQAPALLDRPAVVDVLLAHDAAVHPTQMRLVQSSLSRGTVPKFGEARELVPDWQAPRPERFDLRFRYRGETPGSADTWRNLWWEVENVGDRAVQTLYCTPMVVGENGEVLDSWNDMLTYQHRALFPGETRLCQLLIELPDQPWEFALAVTQID